MVLGNGPGVGLSIIEWCEDARVTLRVVPPPRGPYLVRVGIHDENERVLVLVKPRRGDVLRETWIDMRERKDGNLYTGTALRACVSGRKSASPTVVDSSEKLSPAVLIRDGDRLIKPSK